MWLYLSKRIAMLGLNLLLASMAAFVLLHITPGDPAEILVRKIFIGTIEYDASAAELQAVRQHFELNRSMLRQYAQWLAEAIEGDLGVSYVTRSKVTEEMARRLGPTLWLAGASFGLALMLAVGCCTLLQRRTAGALKQLVDAGVMASVAMPNFYLAILLIIVFSLKLDWLPVSGAGGWEHLVLPVLTLALTLFGFGTRVLHAAVTETYTQPFIVTARAKGLGPTALFARHVLRNAMVPALPYLSLQLAHTLGGVVVVETIFSLNGIGKYLVDSINNRDLPAMQACVVFAALMFSLCNLAADLLLVWLDPRVRLGQEAGQ